MVQIIPKARSTGDRFAQAFANLGESASTLIPEEIQGRKERKQLGSLIGQDVSDIRNPDFLKILLQNSGKQGNGAELERKRKVFEQVQNTEGYKNSSDIEKLAIQYEIMGDISGGTSKSLINAEREAKNRQSEDNFTKQLQEIEGFGNSEDSFEEPTESQNINENKRAKTTDLDAKIAQLSKAAALAPTEKSRKQINDRLDDLRKQQTLEFNKEKENSKKENFLRQETLPIRKDIAERADIARRGIENKEKQIELIDTGKINDPTFSIVMESIPLKFGQRFLSPETVEYKGGLVQGYGDLKNIFSGATRVKEVEILENKIADLYLTDQQKKAILKSAIDVQKVDLIREEAAAELEAEGKNYGVLQFNKEVDKRAKPKKDALFNKILDEQNAIIKDAENRKKMPLDDRDPQDAQVIDQILQEAGGDWRKAEKLAKEKGYKF